MFATCPVSLILLDLVGNNIWQGTLIIELLTV
jgi:hypothetical protein